MKSTVDKSLNIYDTAFFKRREAWRSDYAAIADWIDKNIDAKSFGDIGCGSAHVIASLHQLGHAVWGVDAAKSSSAFVDKQIRKYVNRLDATQPQHFASSDVILCFELAERIQQKYSDVLIKNIISPKPHTVVFTAARPGEAGIHHINLQPREYWLNKFVKHGYYLDAAATEKFKSDLTRVIEGPTWYARDIMIFRKYNGQDLVQAYSQANKAIEDQAAEIRDLRLRNKKLRDNVWLINERLNSMLASARWKTSSKIIRLIKR